MTTQSSTGRQYRWFAGQLRPLLRAHVLSLCLIVMSSLMFLLDPLLIKWLIDQILPKKDFNLLFLALHLPPCPFRIRRTHKLQHGAESRLPRPAWHLGADEPPVRGLPRNNASGREAVSHGAGRRPSGRAGIWSCTLCPPDHLQRGLCRCNHVCSGFQAHLHSPPARAAFLCVQKIF